MTKKMKYCAPANIPWPRDQWGMTSALKDAVVRAASRCGGYEDKKRVLDETMAVALAYIEAKFEREHTDLQVKLSKFATTGETEE